MTVEVGWQQFIGKHVLTTKKNIVVPLKGQEDVMMRIPRNKKIYLMTREYMIYYYSTSSVPPLEQDDASWFTLQDEQIKKKCKVIV